MRAACFVIALGAVACGSFGTTDTTSTTNDAGADGPSDAPSVEASLPSKPATCPQPNFDDNFDRANLGDIMGAWDSFSKPSRSSLQMTIKDGGRSGPALALELGGETPNLFRNAYLEKSSLKADGGCRSVSLGLRVESFPTYEGDVFASFELDDGGALLISINDSKKIEIAEQNASKLYKGIVDLDLTPNVWHDVTALVRGANVTLTVDSVEKNGSRTFGTAATEMLRVGAPSAKWGTASYLIDDVVLRSN